MNEKLSNSQTRHEGSEVLLADSKPWYKSSHLVKLNLMVLSLLMYSGTLGYDASMMNGMQALPQWRQFMNHPEGSYLGFINAMPFIGGLAFYPIQARVADKYGRKPCLGVALAFMALGAGISAGAQNSGMFIAGRTVVGIGMVWCSSAAILITEIAHPLHRSTVTSLYQCQFYVGSLLAAWVAYGVRNLDTSWAWRIPAVLQIGIPLLSLYGTFVVPESPRWLISQGKTQAAREIITKYHAGRNATAPIVHFEVAEIETSIALERDTYGSTSYLDMIKTRGNRHRMLITISLGIFTQWVGNGVASYYLPLIFDSIRVTSVTDQTLLNGFLNLFNLIMAVGAAFMVDRLGRRRLFLTSCSIMLVSYIIITALSATFSEIGKNSIGTAVIPMLFVFYAGYDIALTPLSVAYPAEIWPFSHRARGLAITNMTVYIALLFNLFINPIALAAIAWKYYLVFVVIIVVALVTVFFGYPETKGHTLEEMAVVFDGADASINMTSADITKKMGTEHAEVA